MKEIWLNINSYEDRENLCLALLNAGLKVRIFIEKDKIIASKPSIYWVIFEIIDLNIKKVGY